MDVNLTILVEMKTPHFPCLIQADPHQLSQVVRNLVSNAIKFSKAESSIKITIDIITLNTGDEEFSEIYIQNKIMLKSTVATHYIRFAITDTGAGISKVFISLFIYL